MELKEEKPSTSVSSFEWLFSGEEARNLAAESQHQEKLGYQRGVGGQRIGSEEACLGCDWIATSLCSTLWRLNSLRTGRCRTQNPWLQGRQALSERKGANGLCLVCAVIQKGPTTFYSLRAILFLRARRHTHTPHLHKKLAIVSSDASFLV
jgi:hypothetical protein